MSQPNSHSPGDGCIHKSYQSSEPAASASSSAQTPDATASLAPDYSSLYPGLLPALPDGTSLQPPDKPPSSNAATGASAAGVRALTSQAVAFYFRAPVKAFFRTRVDYLAYARALQEQELKFLQQQQRALTRPTLSSSSPAPSAGNGITTRLSWLRARLRGTTPGVLASAVRHYGWRILPDQVLPPLVANVGVGAVLYTSYLQVLARLHPESGRASKRVYPPPGPAETFAAGFFAGAVQSVVAAPLDAVQARYDFLGGSVAGMRKGSGNPVKTDGNGHVVVERPRSVWAFTAEKLREIGVRGVFAGWGLSFLKDSMGSAVFFSVFEYLKAQGYYGFVRWYYGALNEDTILLLSRKRPVTSAEGADEPRRSMPTVIRPHYAMEPAFLLLAGMGASIAQQAVLHPLSHVQSEHWERLEGLDAQARKIRRHVRAADSAQRSMWRWRMLRAYRDAYRITWSECVAEAKAAGLTMRQWLYRGFWWNTIRQIPSTSAGLIIFELVRRKYGLNDDQVRISRDGYDILLN